jgi:hypothetical protein
MAGKESYFLFNICINFVNKENEWYNFLQ